MGNRRYFTLNEIADREIKDQDNTYIIDIPAIQRGLVWSPRQIELLWDSILREFPVGGVILVKNNSGKYDLIDGQQRFNSIKLGFEEVRETSNTFLWFDVCGKPKKGSTRKYFIKTTTKSHPWGYKNDDKCERLTASDRRNALDAYFNDKTKNIYKDRIFLSQTYPWFSEFPVPLYALLKSYSSDVHEYTANVIRSLDDFSKTNLIWAKKYWNSENIRLLTEKIENGLHTVFEKAVTSYQVSFSLMTKEQLNDEMIEKENGDKQTELEILFERLNTNGTRIETEDLLYSAIKAFWGDIKEENEKIAEGFIPPRLLVNLLFRFILTINASESTRFETQLSIKKIRDLANNPEKNGLKKQILAFYQINEYGESKAGKLVTEVKKELESIPGYIRMMIVTKKPDILLLVFLFKYMEYDFTKCNVCGLILLLFWFGNQTCINDFYIPVKNKEINGNEDIALIVQKLIENSMIKIVYAPETISTKCVDDDTLKGNYQKTAEFKFLDSYKNNESLLLYAQKEYLSETFLQYDPSDTIAWKEHNRPWDIDHILPKDWVKGKTWNESRKIINPWYDSIANKAAIPFEMNREKKNYSNYEYYENNAKKLLFDGYEILFKNEFKKDIVSNGKNIDKAHEFELFAFKRLLRIYKECYSCFADIIRIDTIARKETWTTIKNRFSEIPLITRFAIDPYEYVLENDIDWLNQVISLQCDVTKECSLSLTYKYKAKEFDIGLRKSPVEASVNSDFIKRNMDNLKNISNEGGYQLLNRGWWYLFKKIDYDVEFTENAVKSINELLKLIEKYTLS